MSVCGIGIEFMEQRSPLHVAGEQYFHKNLVEPDKHLCLVSDKSDSNVQSF